MRIIFLLILAGIPGGLSAQDPLFSQFYANPLYLNPALAGSEKCTRIIMNYRNLPYPAFGTYTSYSFSADAFVEDISGGVGLSIIHDNQGDLLSFTQAALQYAYHGRISRNWHLNFGVQAAYINHRLHQENLIFPDQQNPFGNNATLSQEVLPDNFSSHTLGFSSGFVLYNENFYAGGAVHHLNRPRIDFFRQDRMFMKYTLHMGYEFQRQTPVRAGDTTPRVSISPNLIMQSQAGFHRINYGMYVNYQPIIAGVWLRQNMNTANSLIFMLGLKQVNYSVGYSYDHSLSGFSGMGGGAHEIGVLLNFNCTHKNMKYRILNCPTF